MKKTANLHSKAVRLLYTFICMLPFFGAYGTAHAALLNLFSSNKDIKVENRMDGDFLKVGVYTPMAENITDLAWSPDGKNLATTGNGGRLNIIDSQTHQVIRTFEGSRGIGKVAYSPDGRFIALGVRSISIIDPNNGALIRTILGPYAETIGPQSVELQSIVFSPDAKSLAALYRGIDKKTEVNRSEDKRRYHTAIVLYRVSTGEVVWDKPMEGTIGLPMINTRLIFSADGKNLLFGVGERSFATSDPERKASLVMLNSKTGVEFKTLENIHIDRPTALALSPDGKFAATGTSTGVTDTTSNVITHKTKTFVNKDPIRIWDLERGKLVSELPVDSTVISLAFSQDGKYLLSGNNNMKTKKKMQVWKLSTNELVQQLAPSGKFGAPMSMAFSPDGTKVAAAGGLELLIMDVNN